MWIATKKLKVSEMIWILVGDDMVVSRDDVDMLRQTDSNINIKVPISHKENSADVTD